MEKTLEQCAVVKGKASTCRRFCALGCDGPSVCMTSGVYPQPEFV